MSHRRVVITGLGALTPCGKTVAETWQCWLEGRSGVGLLTRFDARDLTTRIAAELRDFDAEQRLDKRLARRTDPFIQYALVAAQEAVAQSGLVVDESNRDRVGVVFGSGIGGLTTWDENYKIAAERGLRRVSPLFVPMLIGNMAAGMVGIELGARGPNKSIQTACATSAHCIGDAFRLIAYGDADVVIAGGSEAPLIPLCVAGFANMKALSNRNDEPERASRPFDRERDGFVIAEGAAAVVLESYDHAAARGADALAEIVGYGQSGDGYHIAAPLPCGTGAAEAMRSALREARLDADKVDYVNAHAPSTPAGDAAEVVALKACFNGRMPPVSSTKSMTGHMLGAAGAIELIAAVLAVREGVIPPTINYEHPDPDCDIDCVPNTPREARVNVAISNSFGFGGHNCCLAVKRL